MIYLYIAYSLHPGFSFAVFCSVCRFLIGGEVRLQTEKKSISSSARGSWMLLNFFLPARRTLLKQH